MKLAYDPTPLHHTHRLLDFAAATADLGFEHMQLTPHPDFATHFRYPKMDRDLIARFARSVDAAGITVPALLPVQRIAWPDEAKRDAAVRNFLRVIEIAVDLGVETINTEFSGRPESFEESEESFYRSMDEILPVIEREGLRLNFDPHPDDFVEDGHEAWRVLRGLDSDAIGFVYVAPHTFHYGDCLDTLVPELGDRLRAVYISDAFDHRASHGLRYIANPPTTSARVHQHLKVGDGDVDFEALFSRLGESGFLDRPDALIVSNVFGENENNDAVTRYQKTTIDDLVARHGGDAD
ncbi:MULTISPECIES: sugar phosphate isomerase/epimerase family protein [unclassified Brevibacterium]|uniref:sugar phosphate isomerase/epimerase family protein n=1 Tax=unclassified Brevibacterium TaxID=2614124 RepID=UPI0010F95D94|nr:MULTISPECIES: sugar phosphate isomerase/epimerase family protein [unclassified Brevibacterium]MCM1011306.1 sugar phosphate isomerase/epimerase [Brevibacterium sp. XM4083]